MVSDLPARRVRRALGALMLLAPLAIAAPAFAQQPSAVDKETARSLMDQGDEKMDAKDYAAAVKAYEAADAIMHLPMTGVAVARAQAAAGLLVEARDTAMAVARSEAKPGETLPYARARAEAADLANRLPARIPSLVVVLGGAPANVSVSVDGAVIPPAAISAPRKVNPGTHLVAVTAPGFEPVRVEIKLREGEAVQVPIALNPAPGVPSPATPGLAPVASPPARSTVPVRSGGVSPLAVAGFSVGGAGLIAGAITGGLSLAKTSSLKDVCGKDGACPSSQRDALQSAGTLANVSNVTIGIGVAGAIVGVVGVVLSRPRAQAPSARVEPLLGPGVVGLRGAF
ncbi:Hypothetical protein A7982_11299 [Minicystis rosea]|nr:Hypothetical protein A7982_11299 [Minicystis rosea]